MFESVNENMSCIIFYAYEAVFVVGMYLSAIVCMYVYVMYIDSWCYVIL